MEVIVGAISAGIALVALVVSIVVARRQTRVQERVAAIEEARRAEELEARGRARVTASIRREERGPPRYWFRLVLRNEGPALARGVNAAVEESPRTPKVLGLESLPLDLQPGQEMEFDLDVVTEDGPPMRVAVRWADTAGDHEVPYTLQT